MSQPALTREGLAVALFNLLQTVPGIKTFSRTWRNFDEVPVVNQPALLLTKGGEKPIQSAEGQRTGWKFEYLVTLYAYQQASDNSIPPSTQINNLMDAIEAVLAPVKAGPAGYPGSVQVLGDLTGRIRHAWIEDTVISDEGVLGPQSFLLFTIEIEIR